MEHITIKNNKSYLELLKISQLSEQEFTEHNILSKAIEADVLYDEPEFCGELLMNHFEQFGYKPPAATLFCLGKATKEITILFQNLVVWGKQNECPECGSVVLNYRMAKIWQPGF